MSTVAEKLLTIEEYAAMPDTGPPTELVRGRIVEMSLPSFRHGIVCVQIAFLIMKYLEVPKIGRVVSNDSGIVTHRDPDSLRGADVAFYSYGRLPREIEVSGYPEVAPDLVFEVVSPTDRRGDILHKVAEYLDAGVTLVVVADPKRNKIENFRADGPVIALDAEEEWSAPDILPGFAVKVRSFFE